MVFEKVVDMGYVTPDCMVLHILYVHSEMRQTRCSDQIVWCHVAPHQQRIRQYKPTGASRTDGATGAPDDIMATLDRNSPMPLWAQLEAELRRRVEAGEFDEGFFPTDLELTEAYDVSRHTVREAVRHLNKTGLLKRERGRGTC